MAPCHDTHVGIEGCIQKAMFWPCIATETYIFRCDIFVTIAKGGTPTIYDIQLHPWAKMGVDLWKLGVLSTSGL